MARQEVGDQLEECLKAVAAPLESTPATEADRLNYCSCRDLLCPELVSLMQEAMEMKWPFVPEKWQYKQSVSATDKTNLSDLISKHLSPLLTLLKAAIRAREPCAALAVVFLVDRFLYWTDESSRLLKITRLLHRHNPGTPVAPQLVIRQARVYLNSGKLQKAEYILSSLINGSGATGCWVYHSESDKALVLAVSVQVRGMILQKLGLWLEAAELIWASVVGYYALPQPDKKGISTSLGLLANILVSMNDKDFHAFRTNPNIDLSLLGDVSHRLLSAAQAAKMAVVHSQYTSLYVLTNAVTQGTCVLSYSFSVECPASLRKSFLLQAKEAFTIGLLTKTEGQLVTSKQELHTFLKAAYSLTITDKWLGAPQEVVAQATQACQKALATFYDYDADTQDKDNLCAEIMQLVSQVKLLLQVEPFHNSDKGSFIPDSYRNIEDPSVAFTLESFAKVMQRFQKYHASLCETNDTKCKRPGDETEESGLCITAFGTTVGTLNTECQTEACKEVKDAPKGKEPQPQVPNTPAARQPQKFDMCTTLGSQGSLGSSWQNFSLGGSFSPIPSSSGYTGSIIDGREVSASNQSCMTTEVDEDTSESMSPSVGYPAGSRQAGAAPSNASSDSEKFEMIQTGIDTLETKESWETDTDVAAQSLSQLTLRTSSGSLNDSFSSQSSWEKISADPNPPLTRKTQPNGSLIAGSNQTSKQPASHGSFDLLETLDPESGDSAQVPAQNNHTSHRESIPQPLKGHFDPNMETQVDTESLKTASSSESSFEMLGESQNIPKPSDGTSTEKANVPERKNPLCYSCTNDGAFAGVALKSRYCLSQGDYQALLAGVCHECLLKRLHSDKTHFKLEKHTTAYSGLHLKFSKANGLWTAKETCVYIGKPMGMQGNQRMAIWVKFLHQEERLSSYVGKDYLRPREMQFHLKDVERQMTAQYYVTEFNKSLYDRDVMAQIFFIPSEALLILKGDNIVGCVTVEPYMLGEFVKLTNNTVKKDQRFQATEYGLAFGHFTYLLSGCQEVVVDLQGWVTANGKGLTYLTDPQIHSTKAPKGPSNFADRGLRYFLDEQHGPECNGICKLLKLPQLLRPPHVLPH